MKPHELYKHIWEVEYNKNGFDLDWKIETDHNEKKVRILFQPSMSVKDWIVNIGGALPVFEFPIFLCMGWNGVFDYCKKTIFTELMEHYNANPGYTIEICGHSYGGSMSVVAGIEIYKKFKIKSDVITFGAPAPLFLFTSKLVAKKYLGKVEQYAHWSDFVGYCPPFIGYHNVTVKKIGKFNLKQLFNPLVTHMIYDQESLYE